MVLNAGRPGVPQAGAALTDLCQTYWYPLYAYVRHRGHAPHDAEDLTQGFFEKLLRLESLATVSPEKGKFRAFLLASMKNFLTEVWHKASAQRRDVRLTIPLDAEAAETRYANEPAETLTPERLFDRQWALTLLDAVLRRLAADYEKQNKGKLFQALKFAITGEKNALPYRDLAAQLSISEEALRVTIARLRKSYRRVLEEEIAHTVANQAEAKEELQALRRILSET